MSWPPSMTDWSWLPTGWGLPGLPDRSEVSVAEWPLTPAQHSHLQTDVRGLEGQP